MMRFINLFVPMKRPDPIQRGVKKEPSAFEKLKSKIMAISFIQSLFQKKKHKKTVEKTQDTLEKTEDNKAIEAQTETTQNKTPETSLSLEEEETPSTKETEAPQQTEEKKEDGKQEKTSQKVSASIPKNAEKTSSKLSLSTDKLQYALIIFVFLLSLVPDIIIYLTIQQQSNQQIVQEKTVPQTPIATTQEPIDEDNTVLEDEINEEEFFGTAPKEEETQDTQENISSGVGIVESYFDSFSKNDFETACNLVSDKKCTSGNEYMMSELSKRKPLFGGYKNIKIWETDLDADFHSEVICVEYDYNQKFSGLDYISDVTQRNSYYIKDGVITAQVCEKRLVDGYEYTCAVQAVRNFCL